MIALLGWLEAFSSFTSVCLTEWLVNFIPSTFNCETKAIFFIKESMLLTIILCFLYHTLDFCFSNNGKIKWATVWHFFRSVGKTCFEELDWTTETSNGKHFLAGLLFVSILGHLARYLLGFLQMSHFLVPWSSLFKLKSLTTISWCSWQPWRPKLSMSRYHRV